MLDIFAADGYQPDNLSLAWMSFKEPKPAEKVEEFLDNGIEKLLFFSAAMSADAIHSQYDIPELVYDATYPEGFPIIDLGAWNDDPIVIQAIKEKIDQFMDWTIQSNHHNLNRVFPMIETHPLSLDLFDFVKDSSILNDGYRDPENPITHYHDSY